MQRFAYLVLLVLPLAACSNSESAAGAPGADASGSEAPASDPIAAMRARIAETSARPEQKVDVVEVEHILIGFAGGLRMDPAKVTRTKEEAEALAASLYARIAAGEDFTALKKEYSDDDLSSGIYEMSQNPSTPAAWTRSQMAPAFGDVGWRLAVGEVSIAPHDPAKSPFGWHLIKRLR